MVDSPTGSGEGGRWLIGAVGTALAVAAFFGIHSYAQLEDWARGSGSAHATSQSAQPYRPAPFITATAGCALFTSYCGHAHFDQEGSPQFEGECNSDGDGGCPVSRVFTNVGTETGSATATFLLDRRSGEITGDAGTCTAIIPSTPKGGSVTARCTIYSSYSGHVFLHSTVENPFD
ncbi:hypothetical protein [Streptomyces sp. NPDC093970]|uniref:hypothetical protein n=1 Tax=Streptomyces sp. NPDC093970 TaxID=3155076 RepID=UPI00341E54C2